MTQLLHGCRVLLMLAAQKQGAAEAAAAALHKRFPAYERLPLLQAALLAASGKVSALPERPFVWVGDRC